MPPAMNENYCCSTASPAVVSALNSNHSNMCVVVSHYYFNLQFPNEDIWPSYNMFIRHLCNYFGEVTICSDPFATF